MNCQLKMIFLIIGAVSTMPLSASKFTLCNNTPDDYDIKIRLKGSVNEPERNVGVARALGGMIEKQFDGTHAQSCIDYIKVDEREPEIFEVTAEQYHEIMSCMHNPRDLTAYFQNNRAHLRPMSPRVGVCFDRRFDLIDQVNYALIIITKAIY